MQNTQIPVFRSKIYQQLCTRRIIKKTKILVAYSLTIAALVIYAGITL